jgi:hypothetical protein
VTLSSQLCQPLGSFISKPPPIPWSLLKALRGFPSTTLGIVTLPPSPQPGLNDFFKDASGQGHGFLSQLPAPQLGELDSGPRHLSENN